MSYKTHVLSPGQDVASLPNTTLFSNRSFEIAVEENILEPVRAIWHEIMQGQDSQEEFLRFGEREQIFDEDDP